MVLIVTNKERLKKKKMGSIIPIENEILWDSLQ